MGTAAPQSALLAIDAGNSFVKVGYHNGRVWERQERVPLTAFAALAARWVGLPAPGAVVISNVAGDAFRLPMQPVLAGWRSATRWVAAAPAACGVVNAYRDPAQLGSDRWACLVAARALAAGAAVVASIGTAVTIDALAADGRFLGGLILPGIALMHTSLAQGTAGVPATAGEYEVFPKDTGNAVYSGALTAIAGAVERMAEALAREAGETEVILSGGAAELIAPLIRLRTRLVPDLVLEGLLRIAREEGML